MVRTLPFKLLFCVLTFIQDIVLQLPYVWRVDYNNRDAMLPPAFNISLQGHIPNWVETFRIRFPCTGVRSAEIHVHMQLNVSTYNHRHNKTSLSFRRNKICLKGLCSVTFCKDELIIFIALFYNLLTLNLSVLNM